MKKKSYSIQLSYDVSDAEKSQAEKALMAFDNALSLLKIANEHLNIMFQPFKNNPDIATKQIVEYRAALRRFRDKVVENFNRFKIASFRCITLMQMFASDTQTIKIIKSFISSIEDIEKQVNLFVDVFSNLESKDFVKNVIERINKIQKECIELEDIIEERVKSHLQSNILGKSWVDGISNDLQTKIERRTPLLVDLFKERQNQLNNIKQK